MPLVCDASVGGNYREAYEPLEAWGSGAIRGVLWEGVTAMSSLVAGADLVIVRCPTTVKHVKRTIGQMMGIGGGP